AFIVAHVLRDEAAHRVDVRIDTPELIVLVVADGVADAGAHRIDHHQVALVEQAEFVVDRAVRARRGRRRIRDHDAPRTEYAHVQPQRGGAGAAVEGEGDGTSAGLHVTARVSHVADA